MCEDDQESAYMNAYAEAEAIEDRIEEATKEFQDEIKRLKTVIERARKFIKGADAWTYNQGRLRCLNHILEAG